MGADHRRHLPRHYSTWTTVGWLALIILIPFIGAIIYWLVRKPTADELEQAYRAEADFRRGCESAALMTAPRRQLLLYRFDKGAQFEGQLLGALERLEAGRSLRVVDTLFVGRDAATGELAAVELRRAGAGGIVAPLVSFRLDAAERRRATERALAGEASDLVRALGDALEPGEGVAAVLVAHVWAATLRRRGRPDGRHAARERLRGGRDARRARAAAGR